MAVEIPALRGIVVTQALVQQDFQKPSQEGMAVTLELGETLVLVGLAVTPVLQKLQKYAQPLCQTLHLLILDVLLLVLGGLVAVLVARVRQEVDPTLAVIQLP